MAESKAVLTGFVKCLKFALEYNFKLICMSSSPFMIWFLLMFPASTSTTRSWTLHSSIRSWVCFSRYGAFHGPLCVDTYPLLCMEHAPSKPWGTLNAALTLPGGPRWCHHHVWVITLGHLLNDVDLFLCPPSQCYMGVSRLSKTHCCSSSISSVSTHSRYLGIFDEISEIKYQYISNVEDSYYSSNKIIVTLSISDWEEYKASFSL